MRYAQLSLRITSAVNCFDGIYRLDFRRYVCLCIALSLVTTAAALTDEDWQHTRSSLLAADGTGEYWTAADVAVRDAMRSDRTYTDLGETYYPRIEAVEAWLNVLERDDLTDEHRIFVWWRIGSLYLHDYSRAYHERFRPGQGLAALSKVINVDPDLISFEVINARAMQGQFFGDVRESAVRVSETYRWLVSISDEKIRSSARRVGGNGYALHPAFFTGSAPQRKEGREKVLKDAIDQDRSEIERQITSMIRDTRTVERVLAMSWLVNELDGHAPDDLIRQWRTDVAEIMQSVRTLSSTIRSTERLGPEWNLDSSRRLAKKSNQDNDLKVTPVVVASPGAQADESRNRPLFYILALVGVALLAWFAVPARRKKKASG